MNKELLMEVARHNMSRALSLSCADIKDDERFNRRGIVVDSDNNPYGFTGITMLARDIFGNSREVIFVEV